MFVYCFKFALTERFELLSLSRFASLHIIVYQINFGKPNSNVYNTLEPFGWIKSAAKWHESLEEYVGYPPATIYLLFLAIQPKDKARKIFEF